MRPLPSGLDGCDRLPGLSGPGVGGLVNDEADALAIRAGNNLKGGDLRSAAPGILQRIGGDEAHGLRLPLIEGQRLRRLPGRGCQYRLRVGVAGDFVLDDAARIGDAAVADEPRIHFVHGVEADAHGDEDADGEQAQQRDGDEDFDQGDAGFRM